MAKDTRNFSGKSDPHFDSKYEGIENDSLGGPQMGLRIDLNNQHPFHVTSLAEDPEMAKFSKWFDGKIPEKEGDDIQ